MEHTILSHLLDNQTYARKVVQFLKEDYFDNTPEKIIFNQIKDYSDKYGAPPTKEVLKVELESVALSQNDYDDTVTYINTLKTDDNTTTDWLVDKTEEFCQDKAIHGAILTSINIMEGEDQKNTKHAIPGILSEALGVSFDKNIGHDYMDSFEERLKYYNQDNIKIPFDIDYLNKINGGGLLKKTLFTFIAGTGVGKSIIMCHMASHNLKCNYNVLYLTLEMSELQVSQRIDANLLDIPISDLEKVDPSVYMTKAKKLESQLQPRGKLIVKEYAPTSASASNFRHLLDELKMKKKFVPDIIYVDYVNLCASARLRDGIGIGSYGYIKAVAEELRAIAVDYDLPVVTATQLNRGGLGTSDVGLENTSESIGLPMTTDYMLAIVKTDELEDMGVVMCKQLKNRYNDVNYYRKFVIGMNKSKMRLHDVDPDIENRALGRIPDELEEIEESPLMDRTSFGEADEGKTTVLKGFHKKNNHSATTDNRRRIK